MEPAPVQHMEFRDFDILVSNNCFKLPDVVEKMLVKEYAYFQGGSALAAPKRHARGGRVGPGAGVGAGAASAGAGAGAGAASASLGSAAGVLWEAGEYAKLSHAFTTLAHSEEGLAAASVSRGGCPNVAAIAMLFRGQSCVGHACARNIKVGSYHDHAEASALRALSTKLQAQAPPSALEALTLVVVNVYTASLRGSWCGNCVCELLSFLDEHKHIKYSNVILAWPTMVREDGSGYVTPTRAIEVGKYSRSHCTHKRVVTLANHSTVQQHNRKKRELLFKRSQLNGCTGNPDDPTVKMRIIDSDHEIVGRALTPEFLGELRRQRTAVNGDLNNLHYTKICHCERPHAVTEKSQVRKLEAENNRLRLQLKSCGGGAAADNR